jgi:hypothetical protein
MVKCCRGLTNHQNQDEKTQKNIAAFLETCIGKPMPDSESPLRITVGDQLLTSSKLALVQSLRKPCASLYRFASLQPFADGTRSGTSGGVPI